MQEEEHVVTCNWVVCYLVAIVKGDDRGIGYFARRIFNHGQIKNPLLGGVEEKLVNYCSRFAFRE